jgi:membrane protease YdiL (CAAX protease family)
MSNWRLTLSVFLPATIVLLLYLGALNFREIIPPLLSFLLIGIFILMPFELYIILRASKREYGKYNLKSALTYNDKMTTLKMLRKAIIPFCIAITIAILIGKSETKFLVSTVFQFVPDYFKLEDFVNQAAHYSSTIILITCIFYVVANVFILPIVEELYFRGYLMPRIERYGKFAPIIITVLFSLYHFWAPWSNIMRILAISPYTYSVWKNKNIYIGIIVHCAINIISSASMLYAVYGVL